MVHDALQHAKLPVVIGHVVDADCFPQPERISIKEKTGTRKNIFFISVMIKKINIANIWITRHFPREKVRRYAPER